MAKSVLGKGFSALINQNMSHEHLNTTQEGDIVHRLPREQIIPSSLQPRAVFTPEQLQELVDSIREHGIIQPLIVRKAEHQKYELIAGERRWRASGVLGLAEVPAIIREASDKDVLELALIENLQRENLNPLEEAAGYMRLKSEFKMKQDEIAKRVGKSRAAVANSMRLLDLHEGVRFLLEKGDISVGHAKVLLSLKNKAAQLQLARDIVSKNYTVRQTEKAIKRIQPPPTPDAPSEKEPTIVPYKTISSSLSRQFNAPVHICGHGSKGCIEISFDSQEELKRILELLGQTDVES